MPSHNFLNYEMAIVDYNWAIDLKPNEFKAYISRGNIRYITAEYSKKTLGLNTNMQWLIIIEL
jgi:hypothetical protein